MWIIMKLTVPILLLVAVSHASAVGTKNKKTEDKTEKRELTEGNAGFQKRAPAIRTASPALSGGIEYADSSNALSDKSPTQQIYSTPAPQFSKVSDLLSGQAPSYQAAIANHLYSPASIYQSRFGQPTTYQVSAPVPSNLAYSEHRLSLPSPNAIQYTTKPQKLVKLNYEQPQVQQSYEQNLASIQQVTSSPLNQQVQYNQLPQFYGQQQLQFVQQPNQLQAITYRQELLPGRNQQPDQRDLKNQPSQILEKQVIQQQIYSTPAPQFSKVSDLLSGQAPSYQAAITNHLYSPASIYQSRFGQPTTYQVSAPVPSNLAYSEHRLSLPSPNAIQYTTKPQKLVKLNYEQPQVQQSYEQNLASIQQVTSSPLNQQVQYNQLPQFYGQQQLQYVQQPNQLQAITYRQEHLPGRNQQPDQRVLKNQPSQILEKQVIQQVFNDKQQNALSYARFSVNQPTPSYDQNQLQQAHQQPLPQAQLQAQQYQQPQQFILPQQYQQTQQLIQPQQYQQPQQLFQPQQQQYQVQAQPLQISYQLQHPTQQLPQLNYQGQQQVSQQQLQPQLQYQPQQPQVQYQEQPQYLYQQEQALQQQSLSQPQQIQDQSQSQYQIQSTSQPYQQPQLFNIEKSESILSKQSIPERQSYFKQAPIIQPNLSSSQPQVQSLGHQGLSAATPTFPPVQYFGKFAQSLFGDYQH